MNFVFLMSNQNRGGGSLTTLHFASLLAERSHKVIIIYDCDWVESISLSPSIQLVKRSVPFSEFCFKGMGRVHNLFRKKWDQSKGSFIFKKADWIFGEQCNDGIRAVKISKQFKKRSGIFLFETTGMIRDSQRLLGKNDQLLRPIERQRLMFDQKLMEADMIFPNSEYTLQRGIQENPSISQKFSEPIFPGIEKTQNFKEESRKKRKQWVFIGRLVPAKGLSFLLDVLSQNENFIHLEVIGSGWEEEKIHQKANSLNLSVRFHGWVEEQKKWEILQGASLLFLPSVLEGFGITPGEGLLADVPCLASDLPVLRSVYKDNIFYADPLNKKSWKGQIQWMLKNQNFVQERTKHGSEFVRKTYAWEGSVRKMEESLQKF